MINLDKNDVNYVIKSIVLFIVKLLIIGLT